MRRGTKFRTLRNNSQEKASIFKIFAEIFVIISVVICCKYYTIVSTSYTMRKHKNSFFTRYFSKPSSYLMMTNFQCMFFTPKLHVSLYFIYVENDISKLCKYIRVIIVRAKISVRKKSVRLFICTSSSVKDTVWAWALPPSRAGKIWLACFLVEYWKIITCILSVLLLLSCPIAAGSISDRFVYAWMHIHLCTYVWIYICTYICMNVYVCVYVCINLYMY